MDMHKIRRNFSLINPIKGAVKSDRTDWYVRRRRKRWHMIDITISIIMMMGMFVFVIVKVGGDEIRSGDWGVPGFAYTPKSHQWFHRYPCQDAVEYDVIWDMVLPLLKNWWFVSFQTFISDRIGDVLFTSSTSKWNWWAKRTFITK